MVSVCLPSDALLQHLPSYLGFSYLGRGVSLHGCSSKVQPLLLTLDEGYLLTTALPDVQCGIAPLGPPAPVQPYAILLFTVSDFIFITRHTHNWVLFLLWLSLCILSRGLSPLFPSSILDTFWPKGPLLSVSFFFFFCYFLVLMGASRWEYWSYETLFKCMGSLGGSVVKNLPVKAGDSGDVGLIPG